MDNQVEVIEGTVTAVFRRPPSPRKKRPEQYRARVDGKLVDISEETYQQIMVESKTRVYGSYHALEDDQPGDAKWLMYRIYG